MILKKPPIISGPKTKSNKILHRSIRKYAKSVTINSGNPVSCASLSLLPTVFQMQFVLYTGSDAT